jgi:hypothetical protein
MDLSVVRYSEQDTAFGKLDSGGMLKRHILSSVCEKGLLPVTIKWLKKTLLMDATQFFSLSTLCPKDDGKAQNPSKTESNRSSATLYRYEL